MKYGFSSKFNVEAENSVEAWDKFTKHFVLDLGLDFTSVDKLGKTFEMKEGKVKRPSGSSIKFKKPFNFRSKMK